MLKYLGVRGNKVPATCFQMVQEIIIMYINIYTRTAVYRQRKQRQLNVNTW